MMESFPIASGVDDGTTTTSLVIRDYADGRASRRFQTGRSFFAAPEVNTEGYEAFITGKIIAVKAAAIHTKADRDLVIDVETSGLLPTNSKIYFPTVEQVILRDNIGVSDFNFNAYNRKSTYRVELAVKGNGAIYTANHFGVVTRVKWGVVRTYSGIGSPEVLGLIVNRDGWIWSHRIDPINEIKGDEHIGIPAYPSNEFRVEATNYAYDPGDKDFASPIVEIEYDVVWLGS